MKLKNYCAIAAVAAFSTAAASAAGIISINFADPITPTSSMTSAQVAGAASVAASNWNNYDGFGHSVSGALSDSTGAVTTASVTAAGGVGNWRLNHTVTTGDDAMYKGFFETGATAATVSVSGLSYAQYDVYVYFDGDNGPTYRTGTYTIGTTTFTVEDSEGTDWKKGQNLAGVYQLPNASTPGGGNATWPVSPNNNEGNYIKFSGLSGASFNLSMLGAASGDATKRAVINGMQIVQIPEPSSTALLGLGGLALVLRRRRK